MWYHGIGNKSFPVKGERNMQIRINVKGASRRRPTIAQKVEAYPDRAWTVEAFLAETVRRNVREYNEKKDAGEILKLFTEEAIADKASAGKVSYGDPMDARKADAEKAVANALQCFDDGMVALFVDGVRYQKREDVLPLREQSEVTFIRLTFLAGRMW